jgi:hypothetical protein
MSRKYKPPVTHAWRFGYAIPPSQRLSDREKSEIQALDGKKNTKRANANARRPENREKEDT